MLGDALAKLKSDEPNLEKHGSSRSLTSDATSESLARRSMPPKTLSRKGSRRSFKMDHTRKSMNEIGHQSCPVITESDLEGLTSGKDDSESGSGKKLEFIETEEEEDTEDVLDDSLHGRSSNAKFRRTKNN